MANDQLCWLTIAELAELIRQRSASPVEIADAYLHRIQCLEPQLNSYITVLEEGARAAAHQAEKEIATGCYRGPLHGIPVALKDIIDVAGCRTTAASRLLADHVAEADSAIVRKLKTAGAVLIGKNNLHELATGIMGDSPYFGATRNPWDTTRTTGGSSGGSAAAVAAGLCAAAIGSDTGSSIRLPAALCGVVGLKPTYGRVSKAGVLPLAWSMDHVGPIARSVEDAAILLGVVAGYDPDDPSSADCPVPEYRALLRQEIRGLRLGIPHEHFFEVLDPELAALFEDAVQLLRGLGARVEPVSLPHAGIAAALAPVVMFSEAAALHASWLKTRSDEYSAYSRARLLAGGTVLAADYLTAQRVRTLVRSEFERVLHTVDAIVTPTVPAPAVTLDAENLVIDGRSINVAEAYTRCTTPVSFAGLPGLTVPCGFSSTGLPFGIQLIGRPFDEATLLSVGNLYEGHTAWHSRRPEGELT